MTNMNNLHKINTNQNPSADLIDSVECGDLDLADAVHKALVRDGIEPHVAMTARNTMALAYEIHKRASK
jgi:fructose-bisphosphate aldolase class 1